MIGHCNTIQDTEAACSFKMSITVLYNENVACLTDCMHFFPLKTENCKWTFIPTGYGFFFYTCNSSYLKNDRDKHASEKAIFGNTFLFRWENSVPVSSHRQTNLRLRNLITNTQEKICHTPISLRIPETLQHEGQYLNFVWFTVAHFKGRYVRQTDRVGHVVNLTKYMSFHQTYILCSPNTFQPKAYFYVENGVLRATT